MGPESFGSPRLSTPGWPLSTSAPAGRTPAVFGSPAARMNMSERLMPCSCTRCSTAVSASRRVSKFATIVRSTLTSFGQTRILNPQRAGAVAWEWKGRILAQSLGRWRGQAGRVQHWSGWRTVRPPARDTGAAAALPVIEFSELALAASVALRSQLRPLADDQLRLAAGHGV
jgi:hypothetical protein